MIKLYENIGKERDRVQNCISKYGWTSDHHLDWWLCGAISKDGVPIFVECSDGGGLLTHRYKDSWRIWSDPLSPKVDASKKITDFAEKIFQEHKIKDLWCDDVSDSIYPALGDRWFSAKTDIHAQYPLDSVFKGRVYLELKNLSGFKLDDVFYSLEWPVLNMSGYDPSFSGGHFKEMRNAKNKFYREHDVKMVNTSEVPKDELYKIVEEWKKFCSEKDDENIHDLKYKRLIDGSFRGFNSARVLIVDGRPVGINAGYEVINCPGRFAGIVGLHDYSLKDLGEILWAEDFEWAKNNGYKEFDMQGSEDNGGLKLKLRFGGKIERKTDTFCMHNK